MIHALPTLLAHRVLPNQLVGIANIWAAKPVRRCGFHSCILPLVCRRFLWTFQWNMFGVVMDFMSSRFVFFWLLSVFWSKAGVIR